MGNIEVENQNIYCNSIYKTGTYTSTNIKHGIYNNSCSTSYLETLRIRVDFFCTEHEETYGSVIQGVLFICQ